MSLALPDRVNLFSLHCDFVRRIPSCGNCLISLLILLKWNLVNLLWLYQQMCLSRQLVSALGIYMYIYSLHDGIIV